MHPVGAERVVWRPAIEFLVDRPELLDKVAQLHQREWGHLQPGVSLADRVAMLQACDGRGGVGSVFLATSPKEGLLGTAALVASDIGTRTDLSPWLAGVYVRAHHRLRGVATQLVRAVTRTASASGIRELYLNSLPALEQFYGHRGWERFDTDEQRVSPLVIMRRTVSEANPE